MPDYSSSFLSALGQKASGDTAPQITVNDVNDENFYLSPEEQAAYQQYSANRPSVPGALPANAYYPNLGNPIGVGNSSGSVIGSHTIYAPGGALVPIGMMDARDKAIQDASLRAQQNVDQFRNQFRKAPTSKLTNINKSLTDDYFNFHQQSWNRALKQAGGDPARATAILKNDPNFLSKDKSYQDLAKRGDAIVGKLAEVQTMMKEGKHILSPAVVEATKRVQDDMNPEGEGFRNLSNSVMKMDADLEFSNVAGNMLKDLVTSKTGKAYNLSNADEYKVFKTELEKLSPDAVQSGLDNLNRIYANSSLYSPEYIKKNWGGMTSFEKKSEDLSLHAKPQDDEADLQLNPNADEGNVINAKVLQTAGGSVPKIDAKTGKPVLDKNGQSVYVQTPDRFRDAQHTIYDQATLSKPVKAIIPLSSLGSNLTTGKPVSESGNVSVEIGGVGNALVLKAPGEHSQQFNGMMVDDAAEEKVKRHSVYQPMVSVKVTTEDKEGNKSIESQWVPLSTVENALRGKKGQNEKTLNQIKTLAGQRTETHQKQFKSTQSDAEALRKKYNY